MDFSSFWHDVDFGGSLFYSKFNEKTIQKLIFSSCWHDLSFWWQFFPFKIQFRKYSKIVFSSFWHDVGFGGSFLLLKIQLRKYSKIVFSSFWNDVGFGGSFLLLKVHLKNILKLIFCFWYDLSFWRQLFSIQHLIKKVFKIDFSGFCSHDEDRWHKHLKMWNGGTTKKSIQKLIFPAFGTIFVLVPVCFK